MDGLNESFQGMNTIEEKRLELKLRKIEERKQAEARRLEFEERKLEVMRMKAEKKSEDTRMLAESQHQADTLGKFQMMIDLQNRFDNLSPMELSILQKLQSELGM